MIKVVGQDDKRDRGGVVRREILRFAQDDKDYEGKRIKMHWSQLWERRVDE